MGIGESIAVSLAEHGVNLALVSRSKVSNCILFITSSCALISLIGAGQARDSTKQYHLQVPKRQGWSLRGGSSTSARR